MKTVMNILMLVAVMLVTACQKEEVEQPNTPPTPTLCDIPAGERVIVAKQNVMISVGGTFPDTVLANQGDVVRIAVTNCDQGGVVSVSGCDQTLTCRQPSNGDLHWFIDYIVP